MTTRRAKPSWLGTAEGRRLVAASKRLKDFQKELTEMTRKIHELELMNAVLRKQFSEMDDRLAAVESAGQSFEKEARDQANKTRDIERQLSGLSENVGRLWERSNSNVPHEKNSGTRASSLGRISQQGGAGVDRNALKDSGRKIK